jgi:hypothetical protein
MANVCDVLVAGEMYSSGVLKRGAAAFIHLNCSKVMCTAVWRQLMRDQPHLVDYVLASVAGVPPPEPADYEGVSSDNGRHN